jgi:hypothetical protein
LDANVVYDKLIRSYSEKNLTGITTQLIALYQDKQYDALREVMAKVSEFTEIREEKVQRCFAYLLKLYHPDKTKYYINFIRENYHTGNFDRLQSLKHIFQVEEMDFANMRSANIDDDIDYHPDEIWDESEISECRLLNELYLSHNQISIIDAIGNLGDLTQLDLSFNQVDDLTPLSGLKHLEYVNIIGNPVSNAQIEILKQKGIFIVN